jgi:cytochrome c-type biogenesis protein CcmH/NrfG
MRTDFGTTIRALHEASTRRRGRNLNGDPIALFGRAVAFAGDFERAMLHINRTLALDGACAWDWNRLGLLKVYRGNYSDATEAFRMAGSLDALNPINFMCSIGFGTAHVDAVRYEEATRGSLTR